MTLKEIREDYVRYSVNVSELSRNLAYAGIGIVWIFKHSSSTESLSSAFMSSIPEGLRVPLLLFVAALILDLFQYVIQTVIWYSYYIRHKKEKKDKIEDEVNLNEPEIYSLVPWIFWSIKLIIVVVAYYKIGIFLLT